LSNPKPYQQKTNSKTFYQAAFGESGIRRKAVLEGILLGSLDGPH